MAADPDSVKNLAADPAHRETLERMRAALEQRVLANQGQRFPARRLGAGRLRRFARAGRVPDRARLRAGQPGLRARRGEPAAIDRRARRSQRADALVGCARLHDACARRPRPPRRRCASGSTIPPARCRSPPPRRWPGSARPTRRCRCWNDGCSKTGNAVLCAASRQRARPARRDGPARVAGA